MPKDSPWKKILGRSGKPKVPVVVDGKAEVMTHTQAFRFGELSKTGAQQIPSPSDNPLEQPCYSLGDAAFRMMRSEADLLQMALAGSIRLYVNVAGMTGRWRRVAGDGEVTESSERQLSSGYLALNTGSCEELADQGNSNVLVFEFPDIADKSRLNFDAETLQELSISGAAEIFFYVGAACRVSLGDVVMLAPLDAPPA